MKIEQKKLSPTETLFYFPSPINIIGTFYSDINTQNAHPLLQYLSTTKMVEMSLLTSDFIYIKCNNKKDITDAELLTLSEIDEQWHSLLSSTQTADTDNASTKIKILIKTVIAPLLQKDGGDLELISYKDNIVSVRFLGKCQNCPYAQRTLKEHVAKKLLSYLPQIKEVLLI